MPGHRQKPLEFFCEDCNAGLCKYCLIEKESAAKHREHIVCETQDEYDKIIRDFNSPQSELAKQTGVQKQQISD